MIVHAMDPPDIFPYKGAADAQGVRRLPQPLLRQRAGLAP